MVGRARLVLLLARSLQAPCKAIPLKGGDNMATVTRLRQTSPPSPEIDSFAPVNRCSRVTKREPDLGEMILVVLGYLVEFVL